MLAEAYNGSKQLFIRGGGGCDPRHTTHLVTSSIRSVRELLGPLLNMMSELSIRKGVLLSKQLLRPIIDHACPSWRSVACTHVRRLKVLKSKCLRLVTGDLWYLSNRQIHEDLGVLLFANHIRAMTASFDSKLADVGNPLVRQLCRYADRGSTPSQDTKPKSGGGQQAGRRWPNTLNQHFPNFFQVGTTFISQNVLRTTLLLTSLKANCLRFSTTVCDTKFTLILFFLSFLD
jgi:hypothetical protein